MLVDSPSSNDVSQVRAPTTKGLRGKISFIILSLVALSTVFYGFLAIDMARVNSLPIYDNSVLSDRLETAKMAETDKDFNVGMEEVRHSGVWLALMSAVTSEEYAYDDGGIYETFFYYAKMSLPQTISISIHNFLGGVCIILGGLQFIPGLRRKAPKLHKRLGKTYVAVVYSAMILAICYIILTPVDDIFAGLTFAFGLWMMAILTLFTLTMAIYHAMKKQIAQHQAYMALNFAILLSAPLLRYDWTLMGMFLPMDQSFMEGHFSIIILLLAHCVISGYLIFCLNRWVQDDRAQPNTIDLSTHLGGLILKTKSAWPFCAALIVGSIGYHFIYLLEVGAKSAGISTLPQAFIDYETQILEPLLGTRILLVLASFMVFFMGAIGLQQLFSESSQGETFKQKRNFLSSLFATSLCAFGLILCYLGNQMGMPNWQSLGGGTFYMMTGILSLLFASMLAVYIFLQKWDYVRECMVLGYAAALALPSYDLFLAAMSMFGITEQHIAEGHAYQISATASTIVLTIAFLYVAYGKATASKYAR